MKLFAIQIDHPQRGWIRVGPIYTIRATAISWLPFVRAAWHCTVRVRHVASRWPRSGVSA